MQDIVGAFDTPKWQTGLGCGLVVICEEAQIPRVDFGGPIRIAKTQINGRGVRVF